MSEIPAHSDVEATETLSFPGRAGQERVAPAELKQRLLSLSERHFLSAFKDLSYTLASFTMATTALSQSRKDELGFPVSGGFAPPAWLLILPLVFFAAHGAFSFQTTGDVSVRGSPGLVELRSRGIVGEILLPAAAYGIVAWLLRARLTAILSFAKQFRMLTLLALLAVISAVWSQNPSRSLLFGSFYLIGTLFAYYLVATLRPSELAALVMKAGVVIFAVSLLLVVLFPQYGIMHDDARINGVWRGMFIDRAASSKCFVFLLSPAIAVNGVRPIRRWPYIAAMLLMIVCSRAATALIVILLYLAFMAFLRIARRIDRRLLIVLCIIGVGSVALATFVGIGYVPELLGLFGRDATLTGRTEVWNAVIAVILKRPLAGYGYYAFWETPSAELTNMLNSLHWSFGYAHNGILEIALQLGLVGVAVFGLTLLRAISDSWFCLRNDSTGACDWLIGLIVLTMLYNIDEATVVWPNDLLSILYVVACCSLASARAEIGTHRHGVSS